MHGSLVLQMVLLVVLWSLWSGCSNSKEPSSRSEEREPMAAEDPWMVYTPPGNKDNGKRIVLVSGDEEYRSEEALPQLGKILSSHHGFHTTVLFAQDPNNLGVIDPNYLKNIPGLEQLDDADLMILFTRFRELPGSQMQHFEDYLMMGKPVLGIRTATHAFRFEDSTHLWRHYGNYYDGEKQTWKGGFGRLVLGEHWHSHHGHHKHQSTRGFIAPGAQGHPITNGIVDGALWGSTDVYGVRLPLPGDSDPIMLGQVVNRSGEHDPEDLHFGLRPTDDEAASVNPKAKRDYHPNDPMMPIAWTKSYQLPGGESGRAFTSTIGASADLLNTEVRRLLVNASYWLLDLEVPKEAVVTIVGQYSPSKYTNYSAKDYWQKKGIRVMDQQ